MQINKLTPNIPKHLHKFISEFTDNDYNGQNHAVWRYLMRIISENLNNTSKELHFKDTQGINISKELIPKIYGEDRILKNTSWRLVFVDQVLTSHAMFEFQANNLIPIVPKTPCLSDLSENTLLTENTLYNFVLQLLVEIPFLTDPSYAEYLRRLGEIGSKAIASKEDYEYYEAVRILQTLIQDRNSAKGDIVQARERVNEIEQRMDINSEMSQIRNLYFWTIDKGMIGSDNDFKIYGSKLLSEILKTESPVEYLAKTEKCLLTADVAKKSLNSVTYESKKLYTAPNFSHLSTVLEELADTLALRTGGLEGLKKLIASKKIGTIELSSGVQVSGVFTSVIEKDGKPIYFETTGPTALANRNNELVGHSVEFHTDGFSSPIGLLKAIEKPIHNMKPRDLLFYEIYESKYVELDFEGGVHVEGNFISDIRDFKGNLLKIRLENAVVTSEDKVLFTKNMGYYDMVIGCEVISAYAGPADGSSFTDYHTVNKAIHTKTESNTEDEKLFELYDKVRAMRETKSDSDRLISEIFDELLRHYQDDWLLTLELYELSIGKDYTVFPYIKKHIELLKQQKNNKTLINKGLHLIDK